MEKNEASNLDLLIDQGKIIQIAKNITPTDRMRIIDALGLRIYPGFIDAHSHIGISQEKRPIKWMRVMKVQIRSRRLFALLTR
jgi:imidazolonepropionase-like amidohydrolase